MTRDPAVVPILRRQRPNADAAMRAPLILHRCPGCKRLFDSPSVCLADGTQTEPFVRTIKLALVRDLPSGQPQGVGVFAKQEADAYIAVDFEKGSATVFPIHHGPGVQAGPARTDGLALDVFVEAWGTCDWGDCDAPATSYRWSESDRRQLPVCDGHRAIK